MCSLASFLVPTVLAAQTTRAVREEVHSFSSTITVRKDASLRVQENIAVRALGIAIQQGIYREFIGHDGELPPVVRVTEAKLDGKPVPYQVKEENGTRRIYLGDPDTPLVTGDHDFEVVYETSAAVTQRSGRDRLYWNVTGNSWDFPIADISTRVELPEGVPQDAVTVEGFTGADGATGKNYLFDLDQPGGVTFTAGPLGSRQGLTVVVEFPSGYIHHGWRLPLVLLDHPVFASIIAAIFILAIGCAAWLVLARARKVQRAKQNAAGAATAK